MRKRLFFIYKKITSALLKLPYVIHLTVGQWTGLLEMYSCLQFLLLLLPEPYFPWPFLFL